MSRKLNVEAEIILRNFMLERFLERISLSKHRQSFILKGGMLISAMVGIDARTTMDMDATIKGQTLTEPEVNSIVEEILSIPIDDGMEFTLRGIKAIHEEADYPGYRVSITAVLDRTRQTLKIDITTGDFVTPREIEYGFKLMFEDRIISIFAYNLEIILAEKFETVITRGVANTRMRDFYDIYILTTIQSFDTDIFRKALIKTVKNRGSEPHMTNRLEIIAFIEGSPVMIDLWGKYRKKYTYADKVTWEMTIGAIRMLAELIR